MEEIELSELFKLIWEQKFKIILIIAIFIILGVGYTFYFVTPKYTSSTTLILASASSSSSDSATITSNDLTINSKLVSTYSELIKSKRVLEKVITNLRFDISEDELKKNIEVSSVKNTEIIKITVSNENSRYACKIANEIAKVFMEEIKGIYNLQNIQVVDEAEISENPSNNHYKRDIAIFALIGVGVAILNLMISSILDNTIKSEEDIERIYKLPVLAAIPIYEKESKKSDKGGRRR